MRNRARYTRVVVQSIRMRGNRVEEHWSQWQREQESDKRLGTHRGYVDWADHPTVWNLVSKEAFGTSGQRSVIGDFADFLACLMSPFERPNALSLCCGNGDFERQLVRSRVLETVDGVDLASARVRAAQEQLANRGTDNRLPHGHTFYNFYSHSAAAEKRDNHNTARADKGFSILLLS